MPSDLTTGRARLDPLDRDDDDLILARLDPQVKAPLAVVVPVLDVGRVILLDRDGSACEDGAIPAAGHPVFDLHRPARRWLRRHGGERGGRRYGDRGGAAEGC